MRTLRPIFILGLIFTLAVPAMGAEALRSVHQASQEGGTGLTLMRTGDQLDPNEMNASIFLTYMSYTLLPLNPDRRAHTPYIDDPRGKELWMTLTFNYGINNLFEVGAQIPFVYNSDLRGDGLGRIGLDGRLRILNVNRFGLGISSTAWLTAPSPEKKNSSGNIAGGGEINVMLKCESGMNYLGSEWFDNYILEPLRLYATAGWGHEDSLQFTKFDPQPPVPSRWNSRDPNDPEFFGTEVIYGNLGLDYEVYDRVRVGGELLARQYTHFRNDNNFVWILPDVRYTYKDMFTVGMAFGFTDIGTKIHDSQPKWQLTGDFTYHFPSFVHPPKPQPEGVPPRPQDLIEMFVPSRKPIPTEMQEQEVPYSPQ